jgi:hypothetical protein
MTGIGHKASINRFQVYGYYNRKYNFSIFLAQCRSKNTRGCQHSRVVGYVEFYGLDIYTLVNHTWRHIDNPEQVNIESGKAYWVYCDKSSQYSGPLEIKLPGSGHELNFRYTIPQWDITIVNQSPEPLSFTVSPIPNSNTDSGVPLSI